MHAITSLIAGVAGAESGYARIYARGTTRRARYYRDFEGSQVGSGDVVLGAHGSATVYVEAAVDVVVFGADHQQVCRFTESATAGCVEVVSPSFTGADYETMAGGTLKPVTLAEVLDRLSASFGAPDFKVAMPDGTQKTLVQALSAVTGIFYNVKSPVYGATGDNVTNDSAAIQAAIDDAFAAGGGTVFFPAGGYQLGTNQLTVPNTVSLLGAGSQATAIFVEKTDGPGVVMLEGGGTGRNTVTGMRFQGSNASQALVKVEKVSSITFRACSFVVSSASHYGVIVDFVNPGETTFAAFDDCDFQLNGGRGALLSSMPPGFGRVDMRRCRFVLDTAFSHNAGIVTGPCTHLYACFFDLRAAESPTFSCHRPWDANGTHGSARCCEFTDMAPTATGAATCYDVGSVTVSGEVFVEDGSIIPRDAAHLTAYIASGGEPGGAYIYLGTRDNVIAEATVATTTITLSDTTGTGVHSIRATGSGNITLAADGSFVLGQRLRVVLVNGTGATRTLSFGASMKGPTFTLANNEAIGLEFVCARVNNGTTTVQAWFLVSSSGALTTGPDSSYAV